MRVQIAVNRTHKGKPKGANLTAFFRSYNQGFTNCSLTVDELAAELRDGYGITTQHSGYRKAANFTRGQHLGLDFDTGDRLSSLDHLLTDPFIREYGAILYTTPSHTEQQPRARVIFLLDQAIYDAAEYGSLAAALLWKFDQADASCKDAARLFFGAGVDGRVIVRRAVLPLAVMRGIVAEYDQARRPTIDDERRQILPAGNVSARLLESHSTKLLDHVKNAPDGQKHYILRDISRTFGGYVAGGYYDRATAAAWLKSAIMTRQTTVKNMAAAFATIERGLDYGAAGPLHFSHIDQEPAPEVATNSDWRQARPQSDQARRVLFPADSRLLLPTGTAKRLPDGRIEAELTLTQLKAASAYTRLGDALG